jgi:RHS repeat-associated protein
MSRPNFLVVGRRVDSHMKKRTRQRINAAFNLLIIAVMVAGPFSRVSTSVFATNTQAPINTQVQNTINNSNLSLPALTGQAGRLASASATGDGEGEIPLGNITQWDELLGGGNPSQLPVSCKCADPIDTATGNFYETITDLAIPGRGSPLLFSRTYNALTAVQTSSQRLGPLGYGWTDNYNMFVTRGLWIHSVAQENGSVVRFGDGDLRALASWDGTVFTRYQGQTRFYFTHYDDDDWGQYGIWKLDRIVDRNAYTTTLAYETIPGQSPRVRLSSVTDPANRTLTFSYNDTNSPRLITSISGPNNQTVSFQYDSSQNLTASTDVGGNVTQYQYDSSHRLLKVIDPNGGETTNQYDNSTSKVVQQTDPMSRTVRLAYTGDNIASSTRITDSLGLVTVHDYSYNRLVQTTRNATAPSQQQSIWSYTYHDHPKNTWRHTQTDPNGRVTTYDWDSYGNQISVTDPLSRTTQYAYNLTNDLTTITHTNALTTSFSYDSSGNLLSVSRPLTETGQTVRTSFTYDPLHAGDVLTVTDPLTHSVGLRYDTYGYLQSAINPLGQTSTFNHNSVGWLLSATDPMTHTSTYTYTLYGEPSVITNSLGYTTTYRYDNVGNLVGATDANHRTITNTYNLDNELTRATNQDNTHSDYGYDALGRVVTQTNPLGQSTLYGFEDINRRVVVTDALGRVSSGAYDLAGATTTITDARGLTTTLGYDAAYQLRNITYHDSGTTPNVSFDYNTLGMRTVMTDGTGTSLYTYDSLNRLKSVQDGNSKTVSYGYDLASRLTSITYPYNGISTRTVTRGHDNANRLTSVTDWASHTSQFGYNPDGLLTNITYPSGVTSAIGYNAGDQLTSITYDNGGTFLSLAYTPDPVGMVTATNEGARGTHSYEYDSRYRLTGDDLNTSINITSTWGYDAATQIVTTSYIEDDGKPFNSTRTYDAANQLLTLSEVEGSTPRKYITFTHDLNGNRTRQNDTVNSLVRNYTYDSANRMTQYKPSDVGFQLTNYAYNGDGVRMSKQDCGAVTCDTTNFSWDIGVEAGLPLLLEDGEASYIYGPGGMLVEEVTGGKEYYYHPDRLGSVRALTDSDGGVTDTYNFDAYGNKLASSTGTTYNPFGYTGQYTDVESGLLYLRARYYDPSTQQFLTVDPLVAQTEQAYAYAAGSPTNFTDPSGLCIGPFVLVCAAAGAEAAIGTAIAIGQGILYVGSAVATGIVGAIGLTNAVNNGGSSCAIPYTYAKPQTEAYPVDSSGLTLITASTTASSNTLGIRSPLELNTFSSTFYEEIVVDIEDPGASLGPAGYVENPHRPGSWGKNDGPNGTYRERWRVDYGTEGKPGYGGKDHIHIYGGKEHLDPSTPFDPDAPFPP